MKQKIELHKGNAYVDIGNGYLLCIGTEEEVRQASFEQIMAMISHAMTVRQFESLESKVVH